MGPAHPDDVTLSLYAAGELEDQESVHEHVASCATCQEFLKYLLHTEHLLNEMVSSAPSRAAYMDQGVLEPLPTPTARPIITSELLLKRSRANSRPIPPPAAARTRRRGAAVVMGGAFVGLAVGMIYLQLEPNEMPTEDRFTVKGDGQRTAFGDDFALLFTQRDSRGGLVPGRNGGEVTPGTELMFRCQIPFPGHLVLLHIEGSNLTSLSLSPQRLEPWPVQSGQWDLKEGEKVMAWVVEPGERPQRFVALYALHAFEVSATLASRLMEGPLDAATQEGLGIVAREVRVLPSSN